MVDLKVGDTYRCPEDHKAKIVWINKEKKVIAVKCKHKHLSKIVKVPDRNKSMLRPGRYPTRDKKIYAKNTVFLIKL